MEEQTVYGDNVEYILKLCRDTFGDLMKMYYEGDPNKIPKEYLPCVIVEKMSTTVTVDDAPTQFDKYEEEIMIKVVLNKLNDLGQDDKVDLTERKLRHLVEARNADGTYQSDSFLYAMRHHLRLVGTNYNADFQVNYDVQERADMMVTSEAQISITARGRVFVGDRN